MYTREYLIVLFFPAQRPYWFVSVLPRNPIPFPYPYFPNPILFPPKDIETVVEMRFFRPFPSVFIASYERDWKPSRSQKIPENEPEAISSAVPCAATSDLLAGHASTIQEGVAQALACARGAHNFFPMVELFHP